MAISQRLFQKRDTGGTNQATAWIALRPEHLWTLRPAVFAIWLLYDSHPTHRDRLLDRHHFRRCPNASGVLRQPRSATRVGTLRQSGGKSRLTSKSERTTIRAVGVNSIVPVSPTTSRLISYRSRISRRVRRRQERRPQVLKSPPAGHAACQQPPSSSCCCQDKFPFHRKGMMLIRQSLEREKGESQLLGNSPICPVTKRRKSPLRHKLRQVRHKPAEG